MISFVALENYWVELALEKYTEAGINEPYFTL